MINTEDNITLSIKDNTLSDFTAIKGIVCNSKSFSSIDYLGIKFEEKSSEVIKSLLMKVLF